MFICGKTATDFVMTIGSNDSNSAEKVQLTLPSLKDATKDKN